MACSLGIMPVIRAKGVWQQHAIFWSEWAAFGFQYKGEEKALKILEKGIASGAVLEGLCILEDMKAAIEQGRFGVSTRRGTEEEERRRRAEYDAHAAAARGQQRAMRERHARADEVTATIPSVYPRGPSPSGANVGDDTVPIPAAAPVATATVRAGRRTVSSR